MPAPPQGSSLKFELIKGHRLTRGEFSSLSLQARTDYVQTLTGRDQYECIINAPQPAELTAALAPLDIYQLIVELETDGGNELLSLASAEQVEFIFDQEFWNRYEFSVEKAYEWFSRVAECDEESTFKTITAIDQELLLLFFKRSLDVGGGLGDVINNVEQSREWDHTFDDCYFLKLKDPQHHHLVLRLMDLIYRNDNTLYLRLMAGIQNELDSELEELCYQFRSGRLADMGFPALEEAQELYAPVDIADFMPATEPKWSPSTSGEALQFPVPLDAASYLARVFSAADSPQLRQEFRYLFNSAIVADGCNLADHESAQEIKERTEGYLSIALQYLSADNEAVAAAIVSAEPLKRLFRLGRSLLAPLQTRAQGITTDNYAANKVILALRGIRPRFYRGLDPDLADGFREFHDLNDLRKVEQFLRHCCPIVDT